MKLHAPVDWSVPPGRPDPVFGTGASVPEKLLACLGASVGLAYLIFLCSAHQIVWPKWQWCVAIILTIDVAGGVVANHLNSAKRFYHSPVQASERGAVGWIKKRPTMFAALHVHTVAVYWIWLPQSLLVGAIWYVILVASATAVARAPLYLARPLASTLVLIALLLSAGVLPVPVGFGWLPTALFLKIVLGHSVREEPYGPLGDMD